MTKPFTIAQPTANVVDPHLTTDRRAQLGIRFAEFETLVGRDAVGRFVPGLASSWTVLPDARTWTFALQPNVMFHDGEMLSAERVLASIARVLDPSIGGELGTAGVISAYLSGASIDVLNDLAIRIVTPEPMADLLDLLVDLPITSSTLRGSGRYIVRDVKSDLVSMIAHDRHWRGKPRHDELRWLGMLTAEERLGVLGDGSVDLIADVSIADREALAAIDGVAIVEQPSSTCVAFLINCAHGPGADVRVRQALNLGLNQQALIRQAAAGDGEPITGPLTPLHFGFDSDTPPYPHDPEAALALLAEAGHGDGLAITMDVPTTLPDEAPDLARAIASQWVEIGVTVEIREHEDREGYAHIVRDKRIGDAACFDSSPLSSYRVLREKFHSRVAGPWWQGYRNPDIDKLLDRAAATADDSQRQAIYRQAYRRIRDDAPWLFLYRSTHRWGSRGSEGWQPAPAGWINVF